MQSHTFLLLAPFLLGGTVALSQRSSYPLSPNELCGNRPCDTVLAEWNNASWRDLVREISVPGATPRAAVVWYRTEQSKTPHTGDGACSYIDVNNNWFCGVTDEFSNVLLNHAMGPDRERYEKLRNFAELLRRPEINNLQCWKYYVQGTQAYSQPSQVCASNDSASDASLRILGAYGIACARQRSGNWPNTGTDYCADFDRQGRAIFGLGTARHGEVKTLVNGERFLANGYNNQEYAPEAFQSFRPDYYELQFLMDYAKWRNDADLMSAVRQMLIHYSRSLGANRVHQGKTGTFDATATTYKCGELCNPAYMDNTDTWRAIVALSEFSAVHPEQVPPALWDSIFTYWWLNYAGGNSTYGPAQSKPFEIYSDLTPAVKQVDNSFRTLAMWIPLAAARNEAGYLRSALAELTNRYDWTAGRFSDTGYYGGYYSQFAQRAIGVATGLIDPATWSKTNIVRNGEFAAGTANWWLSLNNGGSASFSVVGSTLELRTAISAGGSQPWSITVGQNGLALASGATYELSFDARSAAARSLGVRVVKTSGDWREYLAQTVTLGTAPQRFTSRFTVNDTGSVTTNLEFRAGGQGPVDVYLDNVRLVRVN